MSGEGSKRYSHPIQASGQAGLGCSGSRFSGFWSEVETEIEMADPAELLEFLAPVSRTLPVRPGFERALACHLRDLFRSRFQH